MRSGTMLMLGEVNGCIGCHDFDPQKREKHESAFDSTLAGRSPLFNHEIEELIKLTEVNI